MKVERETAKFRYRWRDLSVGEPGDPNPFEKHTWAEILEMSYGCPPWDDRG